MEPRSSCSRASERSWGKCCLLSCLANLAATKPGAEKHLKAPSPHRERGAVRATAGWTGQAGFLGQHRGSIARVQLPAASWRFVLWKHLGLKREEKKRCRSLAALQGAGGVPGGRVGACSGAVQELGSEAGGFGRFSRTIPSCLWEGDGVCGWNSSWLRPRRLEGGGHRPAALGEPPVV